MNTENIFCAVFTVNSEQDQVLITKEYEDDEEQAPYVLCQRAEINGINAIVKYKYKDIEALDNAFSNYSQQKADEFYRNVSEMILNN